MNGAWRARSIPPWRGAVMVAATYFYFLIFAQFAFLELCRSGGGSEGMLKGAMGSMGMGGVVGSLLVPCLMPRVGWASLLRGGWMSASLAGMASLLTWPAAVWFGIAFAVGAATGVLTVSVATGLRRWLGGRRWGLILGASTGAGYAACNWPAVFGAEPRSQAVMAAIAVAFAGLAAWRSMPARPLAPEPPHEGPGYEWAAVTLLFFILVWLDSAAFYVIQHAAELKSGTWGSNAMLWRNAVIHLALAVFAGWILARGYLQALLVAAMALLASAAWWVNEAATREWGGLLYPAGVSLYSVALIAVPAFFFGARDERVVARRAAALYAAAGWVGSGLGIGMAEDLQRIPLAFLVTALAVFFAGWLRLNAHEFRLPGRR